MKTKAKVNVFMEYEWTEDYKSKEWRPTIWRSRVEDDPTRVWISEQEIEIDVPDDFNPVPKIVASLEEEKRKALADYQRRVAEINEQLSKLLALPMAEAA